MAVKIRLRRMGQQKSTFPIESSLQIPDPQETEDSSTRSEHTILLVIRAYTK